MSFKRILNKTPLVLICVLMVLVFAIPTIAEEPVRKGIDVVLLLDSSGSMRGSDRPRNSIEAAKMFIDMMELRNSRISIIGFNDAITGIVEMTEINTQSDKDSMKRTVDGFQYDGYTDIGMSLNKAVTAILEKTDGKNSPMILFLTDGVIEINPDNDAARTEQESYDQVVEALALAGVKIPIYTIGLNHNDSVDKQLLDSISGTTKGRSYIISDADILPQIFNEIFADHIKSTLFELASFVADGQTYADVEINIDNDFVAEANIIMLTEREIVDVKLFDPDGNESEFDQNDISLSKSNKYSLVKVISPKKGVWNLKTKGVKNDKIRVNLIYQYDVDVEMSVSKDNDTIQVTGNLVVNGERTTDTDLYNSATSSLIVTDSAGNTIDEIPLEPTESGFETEYIPETEEDIRMYIRVESEEFQKESNVAEIEFPKEPEQGEQTAEPAEQTKPPKNTGTGSTNIILITALILLLILAAVAVLFIRGRQAVFFSGYIEVRAKDGKGKYTALETPALSTYVKKVSLHEFITNSCLRSGLVEKVLKQSINPEMIFLSPGRHKNQDVIYIINNSDTVITDDYGNKKENKKILWQIDEKIIIKEKEDSIAALEMTYRKTEEN